MRKQQILAEQSKPSHIRQQHSNSSLYNTASNTLSGASTASSGEGHIQHRSVERNQIRQQTEPGTQSNLL